MYDEFSSDENYDGDTGSDESSFTSDGLHIEDVGKLGEIESSSSVTREHVDPAYALVEESNEVDSDSSDGI